MVYFPNVDPTYIHKRKGTEDDPYIPLIDENNIRNNAVVMKEIPSFNDRVKAFIGSEELVEINSSPENPNEFRVDYTTGVAYFHPSKNSLLVRLEYLGTGYVSIPASRVWIVGESGDPTETLEQALDRVDEGIEVLDGMSDFTFAGSYSDDSQYDKWNFVFYNNKTYVALENVSGEKPNESDKWTLVSSGIGFAGAYDEEKIYQAGDIVGKDNAIVYFSKIDNNDKPLDNLDAWEVMISIESVTDFITARIADVESYIGQFEESEEERVLNEEARQETFNELLADMEAIGDISQADEGQRILNEQERIGNENNRLENEDAREEAEAERRNNENERIVTESSRAEMFNQMSETVQDVVDNAILNMGNANEILNETQERVDTSLTEVENISELVFDESQRLNNFRFMGEFDIEIEYFKDNIVTFEGETYICIENSEGNGVDNVDFWTPLAIKGKSNIDITIDGLSPDEEGNISLEELDIVRNIDFNDRKEDIDEKLGEMDALNTLHKTSLVGAINELKKRIDDIIAVLE